MPPSLALGLIAACSLGVDATGSLDHRISPGRITRLTIPDPAPLTTPPPPCHRITRQPRNLPVPPADAQAFLLAIDRGTAWLLANQDPGGGWGAESSATPTDDPTAPPSPTAAAITGLGIRAIAQSGLPPETLKPALRRLENITSEELGYRDGPLFTYVAAALTSGLASLDDPAYASLVQEGVALLRTCQWDVGEGLSVDQDWYGGAGYGKRGRPDLSNTQIMLDALYDAGIPADDPAFQRAVVFLSRCQNRPATNSASWVGNDGGFVYTAANGGESLASEVAGYGRRGDENLDGRARSLRSYGSMTYAGFKSMLYAGLRADDPRVRAALSWIMQNWTFDENPGLGQQGFYYYLTTLARALRAADLEEIRTPDGVLHNWRVELGRALVTRQSTDGSWINPTDRWLEGRRDLATIYAVTALEEIMKPITTAVPNTPSEGG